MTFSTTSALLDTRVRFPSPAPLVYNQRVAIITQSVERGVGKSVGKLLPRFTSFRRCFRCLALVAKRLSIASENSGSLRHSVRIVVLSEWIGIRFGRGKAILTRARQAHRGCRWTNQIAVMASDSRRHDRCPARINRGSHRAGSRLRNIGGIRDVAVCNYRRGLQSNGAPPHSHRAGQEALSALRTRGLSALSRTLRSAQSRPRLPLAVARIPPLGRRQGFWSKTPEFRPGRVFERVLRPQGLFAFQRSDPLSGKRKMSS